MFHRILLVDSQRDSLRSLRAALETAVGEAASIEDAASGEEALLIAAEAPVELVVVDYRLPGLTGLELMHRIRAHWPHVSVIMTYGTADRAARDEMLNAGAAAVFEKPVPHTAFLEAILPVLLPTQPLAQDEHGGFAAPSRPPRLPDVLANFRQDHDALAVLLMDQQGSVLVRAGDLPGHGAEAGIRAALGEVHLAGFKLPLGLEQRLLDAHAVFRFPDFDLVFVPISQLHSLLVAGRGLAEVAHLAETLQHVSGLAREIGAILESIGAEQGADIGPGTPDAAVSAEQTAPDPHVEELLKSGADMRDSELDAYWEEAAKARGRATAKGDVISYEQAKRLGLAPDQSRE